MIHYGRCAPFGTAGSEITYFFYTRVASLCCTSSHSSKKDAVATTSLPLSATAQYCSCYVLYTFCRRCTLRWWGWRSAYCCAWVPVSEKEEEGAAGTAMYQLGFILSLPPHPCGPLPTPTPPADSFNCCHLLRYCTVDFFPIIINNYIKNVGRTPLKNEEDSEDENVWLGWG